MRHIHTKVLLPIGVLPPYIALRAMPASPATGSAPLPNAMKPDYQGVLTHWNRGFIAFKSARRTRIAMLMVPV
jgi:hypothetical protein